MKKIYLALSFALGVAAAGFTLSHRTSPVHADGLVRVSEMLQRAAMTSNGAFSASTIWEVQTTGADGNSGNGGGFDPSNASMATDLAATVANTAAPIITSASFNFGSNEVGQWVFVKAGTNWNPGWYPVTSASGNAATLNATAGAWIDATTYAPSTTTGCATVASPTGGTWSVDYSQGSPIAMSNMAIDGTTNTIATGSAIGVNAIGNIFAVSSGTGFTVQRVQLLSMSGSKGTFDKSLGTLSSTSGKANLGGPLATPGQAGALMVAGDYLYLKSGTYSVTSSSSNVASGRLTLPADASAAQMTKCAGYGSLRGDQGTRPLLQASGISGVALVTMTASGRLENVSLDGATLGTMTGVSCSVACELYRVKVANCTTNGVNGSIACFANLCEGTGCSGVVFNGIHCFGCTAHNNTNAGFATSSNAIYIGCVSCNNTGAGVDGFAIVASSGGQAINCTAYGNGRDGFRITAGTARRFTLSGCLSVNNVGSGFNSTAATDNAYLYYCAAGINATNFNTTDLGSSKNLYGCITLSADPFTNAAGNDFSLSTTAAGAACRAAGIPGAVSANQLQGLSTLAFPDVGAVQHQATGGGGYY